MTRGNILITAVCSCFLLFGSALAQDDAAKMQEEGMKKWMEAATPGAEHEWLAKFAGNWTSVNKSWMDPKAEPEVSEGTAANEMALGGRFLKIAGSQPVMGMQMEGVGYMGYDNTEKHYTMFWIDNMGTAMYTATGSREGEMLTLMGTMDDCMTEEMNNPVKYVWEWTGPDSYVFRIYMAPGTENESVMMEETAARVK